MKTLTKLIALGLLLAAAAPASAQTLAPGTAWILYRQGAGGWVAGSATYTSKAACEQSAHELATRLKLYTGCAVGATTTTTGTEEWRGAEVAEKQRFKASSEAIQAIGKDKSISNNEAIAIMKRWSRDTQPFRDCIKKYGWGVGCDSQ